MPSYEPPKKKRKVLRAFLIILFVLFLGIVALVWFTPAIAGSVLRSQIASRAPAGSTATIGDLRLGWFGAQHANNIVVVDPAGSVETDLSCTIDRGLLALLTGGGDLGTITLQGDMTLRPDKIPQPEPDESAGGGEGNRGNGGTSSKMPTDVQAILHVPQLNITVEEEGKQPTLVKATGDAAIHSSQPVTIKFDAGATRAGQAIGSGTIDVTINNFFSPAGSFQPDAATIDGSLALDRFATSVLAGLAGPGADLRELLGESITADVRAQGSMKELDATVHLDTPRVQGDAQLAVRDRVLSATQPATLRIDSGGLASGVPQIADALTKQGIDLTQAPQLGINITTLRVPLPEGGFDAATYDAQGVQFVADINLSEAIANIPAEKFNQPASPPKQLRTAPGTLRLDATNPANGARLTGSLSAMLDGQPAGNIDIDLAATNLLDEQGRFRRGAVPTLAGRANLRQVPAALVQPLVAETGLDLPTDFGPLLSLDLAAEPAPGADYRVNLAASGDNLQAAGVLTVAGQTITAEPGFRVTMNRVTPTISRYLHGQPVQFGHDTGMRLSFDRLAVNLDALKADWAAPGAVDAAGDLKFPPHSLLLVREGQPSLTIEAPQETSYAFDLKDGAAQLRGRVPQANLAGRGFVRNLALDATATELAAERPNITAALVIEQLMGDALGAFVNNDKLIAAVTDLGPAFRVELQPTIAGKTITSPIKLVGTKAAAAGQVTLGDTLHAVLDIDTSDPSWLDHLAGQPGAGLDTLGGPAKVHLDLTAPKGADGSFGKAADAKFTLTSQRMTASGTANLAGDTLTVATNADLPDTRFLDGLMNKPAGFIESAIGRTAKLESRTTLRRGSDGSFGDVIDATMALSAPKLKSSGPIALSITPNNFAVTQPVTLDWIAEPAFVAQLLQDKANPGKAPPVRLAKPTRLRVDLRSLNLPRGEVSSHAPSANLTLTGSDVALILPDGSARTYSGLALALKNSQTPNAIDATLALNDGKRRVIDAALTAADLQSGLANAAWTGTLTVDQFATPVLDALAANGNTNIADLLGPAVSARAQLSGFPREGSTLAVAAQSLRTKFQYNGRVQAGQLVLTQPADLTVTEVTRDFGFKLAKLIPVFGGVTKDPTIHDPAQIRVDALSIPLSLDTGQLRGDMLIDPGTVNYELAFTGLLNESGRAGDSQKPFRVIADAGVIQTDGLAISVGEYEIPASSVIDLNTRTEDLKLSLPVGALASELARGGGGLLEGVTIGATRQGPLDAKNKWKLDFSEAVKPEKIIEKGLNELFKNIGG